MSKRWLSQKRVRHTRHVRRLFQSSGATAADHWAKPISSGMQRRQEKVERRAVPVRSKPDALETFRPSSDAGSLKPRFRALSLRLRRLRCVRALAPVAAVCPMLPSASEWHRVSVEKRSLPAPQDKDIEEEQFPSLPKWYWLESNFAK